MPYILCCAIRRGLSGVRRFPYDRHRHPGFVIGYVLEGQYRFAVNAQAPTVLSAGQMFFESFDTPGEVHAVSGNASTTQPAKILAIVFTKKGDPVTIPGD